ncbi:hypothetical protein BH09BAC2_BH09BAC2_17860 [soil metagenome]
MKYINNKIIAILAFTAVLFSACKKLELPAPIGDRGQTIVKLMASPNDAGVNFKLVSIQVTSSPQTVGLIEVRRDIPNETVLNTSLTVKIKDDSSAITTLNTLTGDNFVPLPAGSYTVAAANPYANGEYTLTFAPGEFSKFLMITINNAAALDLTKKYAVGLTIVSVVNGLDGRVSFESRSAVVQVGISNQYAGKYKATGIFHHPVAGDRAINELKDFVTVNANTIQGPLADLGGSGYKYNLIVNVDNTVTITPQGATPNIFITGPNTYNPATKTFTLNYSYRPASTAGDPTTARVVEETLVKQ